MTTLVLEDLDLEGAMQIDNVVIPFRWTESDKKDFWSDFPTDCEPDIQPDMEESDAPVSNDLR